MDFHVLSIIISWGWIILGYSLCTARIVSNYGLVSPVDQYLGINSIQAEKVLGAKKHAEKPDEENPCSSEEKAQKLQDALDATQLQKALRSLIEPEKSENIELDITKGLNERAVALGLLKQEGPKVEKEENQQMTKHILSPILKLPLEEIGQTDKTKSELKSQNSGNVAKALRMLISPGASKPKYIKPAQISTNDDKIITAGKDGEIHVKGLADLEKILEIKEKHSEQQAQVNKIKKVDKEPEEDEINDDDELLYDYLITTHSRPKKVKLFSPPAAERVKGDFGDGNRFRNEPLAFKSTDDDNNMEQSNFMITRRNSLDTSFSNGWTKSPTVVMPHATYIDDNDSTGPIGMVPSSRSSVSSSPGSIGSDFFGKNRYNRHGSKKVGPDLQASSSKNININIGTLIIAGKDAREVYGLMHNGKVAFGEFKPGYRDLVGGAVDVVKKELPGALGQILNNIRNKTDNQDILPMMAESGRKTGQITKVPSSSRRRRKKILRRRGKKKPKDSRLFTRGAKPASDEIDLPVGILDEVEANNNLESPDVGGGKLLGRSPFFDFNEGKDLATLNWEQSA